MGGGGAEGEDAGSIPASKTIKKQKKTKKLKIHSVAFHRWRQTQCIFVFLVWAPPRRRGEVPRRRPRGAFQRPKPKKNTQCFVVSLQKNQKQKKIHGVSLHRGRQTLCMFVFFWFWSPPRRRG